MLAEQEEWNRETWLEELRITLAHELTHHLEHLSGLHALDDRGLAETLEAVRPYYETARGLRGSTSFCPLWGRTCASSRKTAAEAKGPFLGARAGFCDTKLTTNRLVLYQL